MKDETGKSNVQEQLSKKVVVITGASSGAGKATALAFAPYGTSLVLAARNEAALNEVATECESLGAKTLVVPTDVTDAAAVKTLAEKAIEWAKRIDVWVNNAGVLAAGAFEATPVEVHDQVIRTNLMGYVHGAHAVLPYFKQQRHGILINNISVGGWFPTPYAVGYSASKYGLRGYSEALRGELHDWPHIHICDLFPGFLDTPGIQHAANYTGRQLKPAPPVYDPQDVAKAIVVLSVYPKKAKTIGSAASFLRVAHSLFPGLSRRITADVMETYFKQAHPLSQTSGNLFQPLEYGTSIHGGWINRFNRSTKKLAKVLFVAGVAAGFLLMRSGSKN